MLHADPMARRFYFSVPVRVLNEVTWLGVAEGEAGLQSLLHRPESGVSLLEPMRLYQLASSPVVWFAQPTVFSPLLTNSSR